MTVPGCAGLREPTRSAGGGSERGCVAAGPLQPRISAAASVCAHWLSARTYASRRGGGSPQEVAATLLRRGVAVRAASRRRCAVRALGAHRPLPGITYRISDNKTRWRRAPGRCGAAGSGPRAGSWDGSSADVDQIGQAPPEQILHDGHAEPLHLLGHPGAAGPGTERQGTHTVGVGREQAERRRARPPARHRRR